MEATFNRRQLLAGVSAAGGGLLASGAAHSDVAESATVDLTTAPKALTGPRMNMAQAYAVMEEAKLDALVLGDAVNYYHATGLRPITTRMGHAPSTFTIITRRPDQPPAHILPSFTYYYQLADVVSSEDVAVYQYTGARNTSGEGELADQAPALNIFPDRKVAPLDDIEKDRARLTQKAADSVGAWVGAKPAFAKALKDLGLTNARLATDCPAATRLVSEAAPSASIVDADDPLRRIRPIKSEIEIELMRRAAVANAQAALAAVRTIRSGASYRDLRQMFYIEAARRGNTGVFMVVDRTSEESFDAPFRDGQSFLIDAVSHGDGYHGDFGRTVFLDEPIEEMAKATRVIGQAWDEIRHQLKPGIKFSEIRSLGKSTLKKLGGNYAVSFSPHSVGLFHTDHVARAGHGAGREDVVLKKGMIISVDCPLLEAGIGGSAHLEDLMLITENGSEPINDVGDQTILI